MRVHLTTLLALAIAISATAQIGAKTKQTNQLSGIWQNTQFGYQMTLILNPDGSGEFDGETIKYTTKPGVLSLTVVSQNETNNYNYTLAGNSLTVSGGDLDQPVTFTRGASGGGNGSGAPAEQPTDSSSPASTSSAIDKALLGMWSGNNESMDFKANGKVLYGGQIFDYETNQGHVMLRTAQGTAMIAYKITGNQMVMTVNGQQFTYTRGEGASPAPAQASGSRTIAPELVGKWCWMSNTSTNSGGYGSSRCIVLNANGTYTYNSESSISVNDPSFAGGTNSQGSDAGTWWVQGDRLFYNSQTSGQGSYRLEKRNHPKNVNDPMIVLDGEQFVTAYQKAPWR